MLGDHPLETVRRTELRHRGSEFRSVSVFLCKYCTPYLSSEQTDSMVMIVDAPEVQRCRRARRQRSRAGICIVLPVFCQIMYRINSAHTDVRHRGGEQ